jgi:long-chain acyl-CoA synthetase
VTATLLKDRFWLKSYPAGVPAEIDFSQYSSLAHLLDEAFSKFSDRKAFVGMGTSLSYSALDDASKGVAAWLQAKGFKKGDRIAIMMPNVLQYPVVMAGILRAGMVVVNVNPLYTPRELEHQLKDSGARAIFILETFATTLQDVVQRTAVTQTVVCALSKGHGD